MTDFEERVRQVTPGLIAETNAQATPGRWHPRHGAQTMAIALVRELLVQEYEPSRERSLAATKLDEFELWLTRCRFRDPD